MNDYFYAGQFLHPLRNTVNKKKKTFIKFKFFNKKKNSEFEVNGHVIKMLNFHLLRIKNGGYILRLTCRQRSKSWHSTHLTRSPVMSS